LGLNDDPRVLSVQFDKIALRPGAAGSGTPVEITWGAGAYGEEHDALNSWHWCSATCEFELLNNSSAAHVALEMDIRTDYDQAARFSIIGPSVSDTVSVNKAGKQLRYTFDLPRGQGKFKINSDAKPAQSTGAPRTMVVMIRNLSVIAAESPPARGITAVLRRVEIRTLFFTIDQMGGLGIGRGDPAVFGRSDRVIVRGWAIDPVNKSPASGVDVAIDGIPYRARYGLDRPDVASYFKMPSYVQSGFEFSIPAAGLGNGTHSLTIRVINKEKKSYYEESARSFVIN
jgi:hypothetical protein